MELGNSIGIQSMNIAKDSKGYVLASPQNQISGQILFQYFYEGLSPIDRNMIDTTSVGLGK